MSEACKKCGTPYLLRDGEEPTVYCDQCAHELAEAVLPALEKRHDKEIALLEHKLLEAEARINELVNESNPEGWQK
jgi:uncharacterized Zn finger protein (UPF0148 family)